MNKKILIIGDGGRGKSILAEKLSKKTGIPFYSIDDFYWKTKFTEPANKEQSIQDIEKIYEQAEWIVEGGSRHLIKTGIEKADVIYLLKFKNILPQYYSLIKRSFSRDHERLIDLWKLLKHITHKKYKKGYGAHLPLTQEMVEPYKEKVIVLDSRKAINAVEQSF